MNVMPHPRRLAAAIVVTLTLPLVTPAFALDPSQPPCGNFDLTHWKITLPVDSNGGTSGSPVEIQASDLSDPTYYTQSPYTTDYDTYFYTASDGSMDFYCPSTGAHTTNSTHTRSELREMVNSTDKAVNWTDRGTHTLSATALVSLLPTGKKTIVGQVHGTTSTGGDAAPLIKLLFDASSGTPKLRALAHQTADKASAEDEFLFSGTTVALNTQFTYQLIVKDGTIRIVVNGVTGTVTGRTANPDGSYDLDATWDALWFYFKAGNYNQNSTQDSSAANVRFYALTRSHSPTITTTALANGTAGTAYSAQLASVGGIGAVTWSLAGGSLPAGLSLSSSGAISGTPSAGGTSSFSVKATDAYGFNATQALSITVAGNSVPNITTTSLPGGTVGTAYSATVNSTGGDNPLGWSVASGSLPAGLALGNVNAQNCTISGTPTTAATSSFTLKVADVNGDSDTQALSIAVSGGGGGTSLTATAGGTWQTAAMTTQPSSFTAAFDVTPTASPNNAVVGLSLGTQTAYTGYACLVRFNNSGHIDVRNAGTYAADASVAFSANTSYHFKVAVDVPAHTYSVYVTPAGGAEVRLAANYAFRTEQNAVSALDHWGVFVDSTANSGAGSLAVSGFSLGNLAPIVIEAESVAFDANWQRISDANARAGYALQAQSSSTSTAPANGGLVYSFTLGSSGTIYLQTRSRSPNSGSSDSCWIRLDGGSWSSLVQGSTNAYTWSSKSYGSVAAGAHTFEIRYREATAVLDEVAVTLNSAAPN